MDQDTGIQHWILGDEETEEQLPFQRLEEEPVLGFWPDLDAGDAAAIEFTRGSTGRPKPVILSHWNFVSNATQAIQPFRVNETDRFLCSLPLSSTTSQVLLVLTPWLAGAACILRKDSSPQTVLNALNEDQITVLASRPETIASLAGLQDFGGGGESSLRLAICNSGNVAEDTRRQFESSCDAFIVEGYGLVEATCLTCANPYTGVRKPGSVGLPLPGQECRILNGAGRDARPGEEGQILVRGPNIMKGYYKDPALTASVMKDGWLHTGDLARVDADGYYYITGRLRMTNDE
jgi:long-subunit acyl-CoA synthetase (AMP-forming)